MNDLLKVLDMSEDSPEQYGWLLSIIREHKACCPADLAFRLRDEAGKHWHLWKDGEYQVKEYLRLGFPCIDELWPIKPIHWIIAALIAKGKEND